MARVVMDIETTGVDFDSLVPEVQEYLLKQADTDEEIQDVRGSLALHPPFAEINTIALLNPETNKGRVFFQDKGALTKPFEEDDFSFEACPDEKKVLTRFWETMRSFEKIVTFAGRAFDAPFILVRSAVHRLVPTRDLMPNRYYDTHIDLLDQLSFYGATRRKFNLDTWCRTFGIKSPKENGVSGQKVGNLFNDGKHIEIARYCAGDVRATAELLSIWEKYIRFNKGKE